MSTLKEAHLKYQTSTLRRTMMFILSLLLPALFMSCANMPSNIGKSHEVVVASPTIDSSLIFDNLQMYNYVPQKEGLFKFLFKCDTSVRQFNRFHTILLYGTLQDEAINILLSPEAKKATQQDTFTLFKLNDLWAKEQLVIVMAVSERRYIEQGIRKYKDMIIDILEENYYARIKTNYYTKTIDQRKKQLLQNFGVTFDVDKNWLIDSTFKEDNFIFVHTHFPDRTIFFYKEKISRPLTDTLAIYKRDSLTAKYYNGDYVLKELIECRAIEFKNMKGIKIKGVWQNDSLVAGGPFISYFLRKDDTLYVIDGILFNPGKRKSDYFTALEVIMNSFEIKTPDK